jgi:DNA-binding CsgD family transcriptional regulator
MNQGISKFSLEFREIIVKVIKEDFYLKKDSSRSLPEVLIERQKSLLDNINGFVVISNYTTGLYEYVSDGIYSHLGHDVRNYTNEELTDFLISIIKEDHRDFLLNCILPVALNYFKEHSTFSTGQDYRYTCCLKVKNHNRNYSWYLVDTVIIEADENGFPIRTLITCTNINQFKKDEILYYNIMKKNSDGIYEVMLEGTADNKAKELKLTKRELEIINLISQGYTNRQLAEKLFISLNTVQTHRKSIMKKTQCTGIAELTNFAFSRGLL